MTEEPAILSRRQRAMKRGFDIVVSLLLLCVVGWLIPVLAVVARIDTHGSGFFRQVRVGQYGEPFDLIKVRTMKAGIGDASATTVTASDDPRITAVGAMLRRWKLDELPQLLLVLRGEMSLVGPRPDVFGYYDQLRGPDRVLLQVRPGLTGPATIVLRHEESLLTRAENPTEFNDRVLFPVKVRMNREWLESWSLRSDITILANTVLAVFSAEDGDLMQ